MMLKRGGTVEEECCYLQEISKILYEKRCCLRRTFMDAKAKRKIIKRQKKLHRNIFGFHFVAAHWIEFFMYLLGTTCVTNAINVFLPNESLVIFFFVVITFLFIVIFKGKEEQKKLDKFEPYRSKSKEKKEKFAGLYRIEKDRRIKLNKDNGLISREKEVEYLFELVKQCFKDKIRRRGICLTGPSGSGKSTIINLFKYPEDKNNSFKIIDLSDSYNFFKTDLSRRWKNGSKEKTVIILDQFERFFDLSAKKQNEVKNTIQVVAKYPVVFIFSMRQEFFLRFVEVFDINHLNSSRQGVAGHKGVFYFKKYLSGNRLKSDNNILICNSGDRCEGMEVNPISEDMADLCRRAFGDECGENIYNHFKHGTLIQQQIIFNMIHHDETKRTDVNEDINTMMKRYFDVQLCSTGDYFMASRIMYLLSVGRNNHIKFSDDDIQQALFIFEEKEKKIFRDCLKKLLDLQLIQYTKYNSEDQYEIAHDYVATAFEEYANTELPANVKCALDEYRSECTRGTEMNKMISDYMDERKWTKTGIFGWIVFFVSMLGSLSCFVFKLISGNKSMWSLQIFILCAASLFYVFCFYMKMTRHYRKKGWGFVAVLYCIAMCSGTAASAFPEFWLYGLGAGNAVLGFSCSFISLSGHLSGTGRKLFWDFGWKTVFVGILLVTLAFAIQFGSFTPLWIGSLLQFVPISALLIYGYLTHLNKEYFYAGVEAIFSTNK